MKGLGRFDSHDLKRFFFLDFGIADGLSLSALCKRDEYVHYQSICS